MPSTTYFSYVLRMWQAQTDTRLEWRASLENIETGKKHGFASLDDLLVFLKQAPGKMIGTTVEERQAGEQC